MLREVFLRVLPSPQKSNFDQESGRRRTNLWMCYLQNIIINIIIIIVIVIIIIIIIIIIIKNECRELGDGLDEYHN